MADTNPLAAGRETLEGKLGRIVTYVSLVVGVLSAVAAAITPLVTTIGDQVRERNWIGAMIAVGALVSAAISAGAVALGRSKVKAAAISADSPPMGGVRPLS